MNKGLKQIGEKRRSSWLKEVGEEDLFLIHGAILERVTLCPDMRTKNGFANRRQLTPMERLLSDIIAETDRRYGR